MFTLLKSDAKLPLFAALETAAPLSVDEDYMVAVTETIQLGDQLLGACLDGTSAGNWVVIRSVTDFVSAEPQSIALYAVANNPLALCTGVKYTLSCSAEDTADPAVLLGYALDSDNSVCMAVTIASGGGNVAIAEAAVPKKRRSLQVELSNGQLLTRESSMRALGLWLDAHNTALARTHGVDRLVWAEMNKSARSANGQVRGWFYIDLKDGKKRKSCLNASDAITRMERYSNSNFHEDVQARPDVYGIDVGGNDPKARRTQTTTATDTSAPVVINFGESL
mgnify:CR=1 FL=1